MITLLKSKYYQDTILIIRQNIGMVHIMQPIEFKRILEFIMISLVNNMIVLRIKIIFLYNSKKKRRCLIHTYSTTLDK